MGAPLGSGIGYAGANSARLAEMEAERHEGGRLAKMRALIDEAEEARQEFDRVIGDLVQATAELAHAERERPKQKLEAITRLCEQDHPATAGKKFSVSQADDFAQLDPGYSGYKVRVLVLQLAKLKAEHALESARMRQAQALLAVRVLIGEV